MEIEQVPLNARTPQPRGTNQYPLAACPIPFDPDKPFVATSLGVSKLGSGVAAQAWTAFGHLAVADGLPVTQPANCTTQGGWYQSLDGIDKALLTFFACGFNGGTTAYAACAAGETYAARIWLVRDSLWGRRNEHGRRDKPFTKLAIPALDITMVTGPQLTTGDRLIPSGVDANLGRIMTSFAIVADYTHTPGMQVLGGGAGISQITIDTFGHSGMIISPYTMPANRGLGWWLAGV